MSTVQSLYSLVQYRNGITVSLDDLIHIVNNAVRTIAKRLYWLESDLLREEMSVSVWAQVTHTGTDITFNNVNPDTITSATGGFVTSGFAANMPIYTNSATNPGPYRIAGVADKTITLASTDSVTAAVAASVTITSYNNYGFLPTGFWGLIDDPYLDGKTYPMKPLPNLATKLVYETNTGEPIYYQIKGSKIYVIPAAGSDCMIKADYFARPVELTATTDTLPFDEMFDDVMAEYVMRYFRGGVEGQAATVDLNRMLVENVDLIAGKYSRKSAVGIPEGIPWNAMVGDNNW